MLAERRNRTQGAIDKARADIALAASRTAEYENSLRDARLAIFRTLDQRRKQASDARAAALAQAREQAQKMVAQAKADIEAQCADARTSLATDSDRVANQIIQTLLQSAGSGPSAIVGGQ